MTSVMIRYLAISCASSIISGCFHSGTSSSAMTSLLNAEFCTLRLSPRAGSKPTASLTRLSILGFLGIAQWLIADFSFRIGHLAVVDDDGHRQSFDHADIEPDSRVRRLAPYGQRADWLAQDIRLLLALSK